jgi:small subunit ribosomal protein S4e
MSRKNHMSRLAAPKTWPIKRKGIKWISKSAPGTHNQDYSLPLLVLCRDMLGIVSTVKETKQILNKGHILVNNKIRKKHRFPAGLFDVISIPSIKEHYRVIINNLGKLDLTKIPETESNIIPLKVVGKTSISKGKTQINLNNGWNILEEKEKPSVGDVVLYDLKANKIGKVIKQKKGNTVFIFGGKHHGQVAELKDIVETGKLRKTKIAVIQVGKNTWETPLKYIFMIGEKKPELTLLSSAGTTERK